MSIKKYVFNALVGMDDFGNCLLGGTPDETISARAGRAKKDGKLWGKALGGVLDWLQKDHVETAIANDQKRAEDVVEREAPYVEK